MDILYYSKHCPSCQKLLPYLVKTQISNQLNFICVDRRAEDPRTGQIQVVLDNGKKVMLPPNVHRVPTLLQQKNYRAIVGDEIYSYLQPLVKSDVLETNGEPVGFEFSGSSNHMNVMSEKFTSYDNPALGGSLKPGNSFANAFGESTTMHTPQETYKPDKIGNVTVESLQQQRNMDLQTHLPPMASQLQDAMSAPTFSNQRPPYATMAVLPPTKSRGEGRGGGAGNPTTYSPLNGAPKYTAEDAREILFGKNSGWNGPPIESTPTSSQGHNMLPASYLNQIP